MTGFHAGGVWYDIAPGDGEYLLQGVGQLREAGIPDPRREAQALWVAAMPRRSTEYAQSDVPARFLELVARRCAGEPQSHLTGGRWFYEHRFNVTPDVLDPRPETEELVRAALEVPWQRVLDLGTGSGCILLSLLAARPRANGLGVDLSEAALAVAKSNRAALGLEESADLRASDWYAQVEGDFDLIVSNPPYIARDEMESLSAEVLHEPRMALTDGADGLDAYRAITAGAASYLRPGGWLMVEIGPTQGAAVRDLFHAGGFAAIATRHDLDGRERVILGQKPQN